jgi:glutaredoxin-like protein NrdH
MVTVTLYTLSGCVDCQAAGQAMDRKDISFGLIDVAALPAAAAFIRSLGYQGVPVTVIRNVDGTVHDHWHGFRPDKVWDLALHHAQLS